MEEIYAHFEDGSHGKYRLEDNAYLIPTDIDRIGLSKMVNDLLKLEEPVPFDFLLNDEPLCGTISEMLEEQRIKSETTIQLVYTLAIKSPSTTVVDNLNGWISCISCTNGLDASAICCYNGQVRVYEIPSMKEVSHFLTDPRSVASVYAYNDGIQDSCLEVICGQTNGHIGIHKINVSGEDVYNTLVATNECTSDTISAIAMDSNGYIIAAGGKANDISLYEHGDIFQAHFVDECPSNVHTKRPLSEISDVPLLTRLEKHKKPITGLEFIKSPHEKLLSSSLDGSLIIWDVNERCALSAYNGGKAITCLGISKGISQICTGHEEGTVRIWDLRSGDGTGVTLDLNSLTDRYFMRKHSGRMFNRLVSDVCWNPSGNNMVAAIGLDGNVVLVDIRSAKVPLHLSKCELNGKTDRGTGCSWVSSTELICVTASGLIRKYKYG